MTGDATTEARPHPRTVFISHSGEDRATAQRLRAALERVGMKTVDPLESATFGDNLLAVISAAIERADMAVVLVSTRSAKSDWVDTEAAIAVGRVLAGRGGRVVPVVLDNAELPFLLQDFQSIRVDRPQDLDRVAEAISRLPEATAAVDEALWRSAEFQRRSLNHERLRYEAKQQVQDAQRQRVAVLLSIVLAGTVVLMSITALIFWRSDLLATVLSPAATLLGIVVAFYFGRRSSGEHAAHRDRSDR